MKRKPLRKALYSAFDFMDRIDHPALYIEMRLGKTLLCCRYIKYAGYNRVLIIGSESTIFSWKYHLEYEGIRYTDLVGQTKEKRLNRLRKGLNRVTLLNPEGYRVIPEIADIYFDCVIFDESYRIRNNTLMTRFYIANFRSARKRIILSGLPIKESKLEYFHQLKFLDNDIWGERNYYKFRHKYFYNSYLYTWVLRPNYRKRINNIIARNCYFLSSADAKMKKERLIEDIYIPMSTKMHRIYDSIAQSACMKGAFTKFRTVQYLWLRRLFGGYEGKELIDRQKIIMLKNLLKHEFTNKKVVVSSHFIDELKMLNREIQKFRSCAAIYSKINIKKRLEINQAFQKGDLQTIVIQSGSTHGRDFSAGKALILYTPPEGVENYGQLIDRIVDFKVPSIIYRLIYKGGIEKDIYTSYKLKESSYNYYMRLIRSLQRRIN